MHKRYSVTRQKGINILTSGLQLFCCNYEFVINENYVIRTLKSLPKGVQW